MDQLPAALMDPAVRLLMVIAIAALASAGFAWWLWYDLSGTKDRRQRPLRRFDKDLLEYAYEEQPEQWAAIQQRGTISWDELARAAGTRLLENHEGCGLELNKQAVIEEIRRIG